jgi:SAM-dependent methyltransferase
VTLHPLAERFALVADAYERGRPDYSPAVVGALAAELGLAPGAPVLDLAAGTGKLTRALLAFGFDAVAVEPQAPLRELLAGAIGTDRALEGVAEKIPLPDASVALVTVADAFHWFDQSPALAEVRRVLSPGGGFAVLVTVPDLSGGASSDELRAMLEGARPAHPFFDGPSWREAVIEDGGFAQPREIRVGFEQTTDAARVLDYLSSISWVAALPPADREALLQRASALVGNSNEPFVIPIQVVIGITTPV